MKKIISAFLVLAYLNCYLGCTSTKILTVEGSELPESLNHSNEYALQIVTVDSARYAFEKHTYRFRNDTLIAKKGHKIPLNDIAQAVFITKETDTVPTLLLITGGILLVAGVIVFLTGDILSPDYKFQL